MQHILSFRLKSDKQQAQKLTEKEMGLTYKWVNKEELLDHLDHESWIKPVKHILDPHFSNNVSIRHTIAPVFGKKGENEKRIDGITAILFDPNTQEYGYLERADPHRYVQVCG